jgi:hypothetical protein
VQVLPNKFGVYLREELFKKLERDAVGPVPVDVVEKEGLETVGVEVARLILVVDGLVEEVDPPDLAL